MWPFRRKKSETDNSRAEIEHRTALIKAALAQFEEETTSLDELLVRAMAGQPKHVVARSRLVLANFLAGRVDPEPDERLINIQTWAMLIARELGASNPREALDLVREFRLSDEEWAKTRGPWEFLWKGLPPQ